MLLLSDSRCLSNRYIVLCNNIIHKNPEHPHLRSLFVHFILIVHNTNKLYSTTCVHIVADGLQG